MKKNPIKVDEPSVLQIVNGAFLLTLTCLRILETNDLLYDVCQIR